MKARKLLYVWLVGNLVLIWGNSLLPGEISGAISEWVKGLVSHLFQAAQLPAAPGSGLVRKAAHFLEFTSLGLVLSCLFGMPAKIQRRCRWLPLLWGAAAACVDELIQRFVPGRCGCIQDVCLDVAGVLFGIALVWLATTVHYKMKKNLLEETK